MTLPSRARQAGISLIATMVGLMLGLFAALSIMSIFKTQAKAVIQTRTNSALDGQVATALLVSELEMQRAGWGVEAPAGNSCTDGAAGPAGTANTDFVLANGAGFAADDSTSMSGDAVAIGAAGAAAVNGNAVFWHFKDDAGASKCTGLFATNGGLFRLAEKTCTDASSWSSTWHANEIIPVVQAGTLSAAGKAIQFGVQRVPSCAPYGRMAAGPGLRVIVSAGQSMDNLSSSVTSCVPNICQ